MQLPTTCRTTGIASAKIKRNPAGSETPSQAPSPDEPAKPGFATQDRDVTAQHKKAIEIGAVVFAAFVIFMIALVSRLNTQPKG